MPWSILFSEKHTKKSVLDITLVLVWEYLCAKPHGVQAFTGHATVSALI